jgi:hypothetical protein
MTDKTSQSINKISFKIGVVLLAVACLLWMAMAAVPFLSIEVAAKAGVVGALLIVGEVAFWLGAILTGKEFVAKYKQRLDPRNWKQER